MNILNDTEHRIFLSAMAREKEICQKIDGDKIHDSTVKMLVPVCESIERKVDKAILIPEGATNGDMIKAIFPNANFDNAMPFTDNRWETIDLDTENKTRGTYKPTQLRVFADWWNTPYKGVEND